MMVFNNKSPFMLNLLHFMEDSLKITPVVICN